METIINSLMEKYFAVLFKNFKKENLKVSLFEGLSSGQSNLTLNDLDFTEAVIQELLYIPPQLEVQSARVNSLRIMVPWSRLKSDPIVFNIDQIAVSINEPLEIKPAPRLWSQFQEKNRKGKPEEKRDRRDLLSTLKVIVKQVHISVKTLNGSALTIEIFDVVMQSTNGEWKVVSLEQAHLVDKERKREQQFKEITASRITMHLDQGKLSHTILRDLPLRIQMTTMYSTDEKIENDLLAVSIETYLEQADFAWNQTSWKMMLNLIHGLVTCIKRPAPPAIEKKEAGSSSGPENLSLGLNIGGWSLELKQDGSDQGFSFFGFGLRFLVVPERHVIVPPRTEAIESSLLISVQSFTFRELVAGKDKDPRYQKLITQAMFPDAVPDNILTFKITSRRSDKEQLSSLMALQLDFTLNGIQIVFDSEIWHNLKQFLELRADATSSAPPSPAVEHATDAQASPSTAATVAELAKKTPKLDFQQLARTSGIVVQAVNTVLILPNDKRKPQFAEKSLQLTIGKVGISNRPDWKVVPPMGEVAKSVPFNAEALSFVTDEHQSSYRFQAEVSDVSFDLVDLKDNIERVLAPTSVRLQTRYVKIPAGAAGHPVYQLELALSWGQMDLRLTRAQYQYFHDVGHHYTEKIKAIIVAEHKGEAVAAVAPAAAEVTPEQRAAQIEEYKNQASDYIHKVAENPQSEDTAVVSQLLAKAESGNKLAAVEYGLQVFRVALLLRAEGGTFDLPLKAFGVPPERVSEDLTTLKFSDLQLLFENSCNTQGVMLRMGGIGAENLDHDRIPVALSITPTGVNAHPLLYDKASNYAFHLYFVHQSNLAKKEEAAKGHAPPTKPLPAPPPGKAAPPPASASSASSASSPSSEIGFRIGGVRVKVKRRPPVAGAVAAESPATPSKPLVEELNALVPTLKEMATGLMAKFTSRATDVEKGVDLAKKSYDYLDIHWAVELGDAEFMLLESDGNSRGQFRVGSSSKEKISKQFATLEDELVACKMALAQADQDREALANALADAKQEVAFAKESAKKDQGVLEQVLIETKLKLAEAESELMSSRAPKGPAPTPARKK